MSNLIMNIALRSHFVKIVKFQTAVGTLPPKKLQRLIVSEQCYHNTLTILGHYVYSDMQYVEGWLINDLTGSRVKHVWCKYEGKYFDLTLELSRHLKVKDFHYCPVIEGTLDELREKGYTFNHYWLPLMEQIID